MTDASDRKADTLADLLGSSRADGHEPFNSLFDFVADDRRLTEDEKSFLRLAHIFTLAAVEGATREESNGADRLDIVHWAARAAGWSVAALLVQTCRPAGQKHVLKRLVRDFEAGARTVVDAAARQGEGGR